MVVLLADSLPISLGLWSMCSRSWSASIHNVNNGKPREPTTFSLSVALYASIYDVVVVVAVAVVVVVVVLVVCLPLPHSSSSQDRYTCLSSFYFLPFGRAHPTLHGHLSFMVL